MHEATESQLAKGKQIIDFYSKKLNCIYFDKKCLISLLDVNVNLDDLQSVLKFKSFEDITQEFLSIISTKNEGVIREIKKIQDEVIKIENMKRDFENLMETFANKYHEETQLLYKKLNVSSRLNKQNYF